MKTKTRSWPWFAIGIPAIFLAGLLVILSQDRAFRFKTIQELSLSTRVTLAAIDVSRIDRLAGSEEDLASPDYQRLREQLARITEVFGASGLRGLYVMKRYGDEVRFMVDSAPVEDPWHSEPGTVYEEVSQTTYDAFSNGQRRVVGPETDEYGTFYSSLDPIVDADGKTKAVLGADIEASAYDQALNAKRLPIVIATGLLALLYVVILLIVRYRQQKQRYIRSYTNRLEVLIDQMPVGVLIFESRHGKPTMTNEAAQRLLGQPVDPAKDIEHFVETYHVVDKDGKPFPPEELPVAISFATGRQSSKAGMFFKQSDGSKIAVRMASVPIRDEDDKITAVVAVLEDMTKEYEADRQKSEFVAVAAHELRTPLTAIRWNTELLLDKNEGELSANQREYAQHIDDVNVRLISLLNELLEVARIETGSDGVNPVKTDVVVLIGGAIEELKGLSFLKRQTVEFTPRPLPEINIDPRLIRQVVTNLLSNAIKYTPEGGAITVKAETVGGDLRVSFKDTGIGIPKAQQSQIFKKFFRADNAAASQNQGTGLGLFICQQAIERSGGAIGFDSEENKGATFWFTLPLSGSQKLEGAKRRP